MKNPTPSTTDALAETRPPRRLSGSRAPLALLAICLLIALGSAQAQLLTSQVVTKGDLTRQAGTSGVVTHAVTWSELGTAVTGEAKTSFGVCTSHAESINTLPPTRQFDGSVDVYSVSSDLLTIVAGDRTGPGTLTIKVKTGGILSATTGAYPGGGNESDFARAELNIGSLGGGFRATEQITVNGTVYVSGVPFVGQEIEAVVPINFGAEFSNLLEINLRAYAVTNDPSAEERCIINLTTNYGGIVSLKDANGVVITDYTITSASGTDYTKAITPPAKSLWEAGADLQANESGDLAGEAEAVNATVPEWSYGFRTTAAGSNLTLFTTAQHQNGVGNPEVDGWIPGSGVLVNTGSVPVTVDLGGSSEPVKPGQLLMQPTATQYAVARWTAPASGTYNVAARWVDVETGGGNGASAHVVVNGQQIFGGQDGESGLFTGGFWDDGGKVAMAPRSLHLIEGATVDFVVGSRGEAVKDLTAMNALVRRAPTVTMAAPVTATEGNPVNVSVTSTDNLTGVSLRQDGLTVGTDLEPPFDFVLTDLTPGVYHLQAEGIDSEGVLGASEVIILTVNDAPATTRAGVKAVSLGATYECITSGTWSQADIWRRKSDGASGVPGVNDVAILPASVQVVIAADTTVKKVFSEGRITGDTSDTTRNFTVTRQLNTSGALSNLTVTIPSGGVLANVRQSAFFENVKIINRGQMVVEQSLFATGSEIISTGSINLRTPPASGGPTLLQAGTVQFGGFNSASPGTGFVANSLIGLDGSTLIGNDGSTLIGNDGSTLVGNDGASLIGNDGSTLIGNDGSTLIGLDGSTLIGNDGSTLVGNDGASLIGNDGSTLSQINAAALIGNDGSTRSFGPAAVSGITFNNGVVSGRCNLVGNVAMNGGYLSPGASAGAVFVRGNLTLDADSTILLEVGGTTIDPLTYDWVNISGTANLGGNLIVRTIDDYVPQSGDSIPALTFGARTGDFASVSSNADLTFGANGASLAVSGANPPSPKALNISTRMRVETGDNVLIGGFIITGDQPKKVIIRGIGPSLPLAGVLADPVLILDGGAITNDNWQSDQKDEIAATLPPNNLLESAIIATLPPGGHTAILQGKDGGTGVGLVEVYDLEGAQPGQLANISTRGFVQTGDDVMIGGFIVDGDFPAKVIVRALGPSLASVGVAGALANPTLELFDSNGNSTNNDDWRATQEAEILAAIPPADDREAAIIATLAPGAYTAIVRGQESTTGVALIEVYNLE